MAVRGVVALFPFATTAASDSALLATVSCRLVGNEPLNTLTFSLRTDALALTWRLGPIATCGTAGGASPPPSYATPGISVLTWGTAFLAAPPTLSDLCAVAAPGGASLPAPALLAPASSAAPATAASAAATLVDAATGATGVFFLSGAPDGGVYVLAGLGAPFLSAFNASDVLATLPFPSALPAAYGTGLAAQAFLSPAPSAVMLAINNAATGPAAGLVALAPAATYASSSSASTVCSVAVATLPVPGVTNIGASFSPAAAGGATAAALVNATASFPRVGLTTASFGDAIALVAQCPWPNGESPVSAALVLLLDTLTVAVAV